jgi:hypothetical protein
MKEWLRKLRYKLAYIIAPDWIDDLEHRLSGLLCEVTGSRWSKAYYPLDVMISCVNDYQQKCCDECEYYLEYKKNEEIDDTWVITENGCVITCPNCGERLELCYPDGTEVRYLPHCPWCGKKLEETV